jgi:hypothetical protein
VAGGDHLEPRSCVRCASLALAPLPLIFSHKSETPLCGTEAWASQRPGDIIVMILEMHGRPTKAGDTFSAAHIVGWFDEIEEMHTLASAHHGCTVLTADKHQWQLS